MTKCMECLWIGFLYDQWCIPGCIVLELTSIVPTDCRSHSINRSELRPGDGKKDINRICSMSIDRTDSDCALVQEIRRSAKFRSFVSDQMISWESIEDVFVEWKWKFAKSAWSVCHMIHMDNWQFLLKLILKNELWRECLGGHAYPSRINVFTCNKVHNCDNQL